MEVVLWSKNGDEQVISIPHLMPQIKIPVMPLIVKADPSEAMAKYFYQVRRYELSEVGFDGRLVFVEEGF